MPLTREQILGMPDLEIRTVEIPHWGEVNIRMMSALERARVEVVVNRMNKDNQAPVMAELKALVASIVLCDEKGDPLFKKDDLRALGQKNDLALKAILKEAQKDAKLDDEGKEVEEQEKNSESDPT